MNDQRSLRVTGAVFGVWLSVMYAFLADNINRANLPGIPLPEPQGGFVGYYLGALLVGLLIGLAAAWPDNRWLGALLGGVIGAVLAFISPWQAAMSSGTRALGFMILTLTTFIPLALILMLFALLIRFSVERLPTRWEEVLSLKRIGLPLLTTALAIGLGASLLHSSEARAAFYTTQALIDSGLKVASQAQLPENLQPVLGFKPNANGSYTLEWSDNVDTFMGPRPVTSKLNSDFLMIARFKNGFSLACIFAPGEKMIPCANY